MQRIWAAVLLLLQDKTAEEAFKRLEDSMQSAKTVCVKFKVTMAENGKTQLTGSGELLLKDRNKLNYTIKTLEKGIHVKEYRFVSDGSMIKGAYYRTDSDPSKELEQVTPEDLSANFIAGLSKAGVGGVLAHDVVTAFLEVSGPNSKTVPLRWKGMLRVSGVRQGEENKETPKSINYTLQLGATASAPTGGVKVWIDPGTGMPTKRVLSFAEYTFTEEYEEFSLNREIADDRFKIQNKK